MKIWDIGFHVKQWKDFLVEKNLLNKSDDIFDSSTLEATIQFQSENGLKPDGVVGPKTIEVAKKLGYFEIINPWRPSSRTPLSFSEKQRVFGPLVFVANPNPSNPESVKITNDWSKNVKKIQIKQLIGIPGAPKDGVVLFHQKGLDKLQKLWERWELEGLLPLVLSWEGSWVPRFVRGSKSTLSSHAFATAFDINAKWNPIGKAPARPGETGSVIDLVPFAYELGFAWGGDWSSRPDGMHFELVEP